MRRLLFGTNSLFCDNGQNITHAQRGSLICKPCLNNFIYLPRIPAYAAVPTGGWTAAPAIVSYSPTTGDPIAAVTPATRESYDQVVAAAQRGLPLGASCRRPSAARSSAISGALLREYKEPLGELVSLEMGKIRVEGLGEVQEMIDICDFAVGLSRQLYGLTMHSERPGHRMIEQWHPLGPVGIITAFNFPVAVWSWNAAIAAVCGDTMVWKPVELAPLCGVAVQHIANR